MRRVRAGVPDGRTDGEEPARPAGTRINYETKSVDTLCPYCGVGCQTTVHVKDNKILYVDGRDGPANNNRLCVKGRFGFDYIHHPDRLTKPLIRRDHDEMQAPKAMIFVGFLGDGRASRTVAEDRQETE